jgi:hypothetical protein
MKFPSPTLRSNMNDTLDIPKHKHDEEMVCPTCLVGGMEVYRLQLLAEVEKLNKDWLRYHTGENPAGERLARQNGALVALEAVKQVIQGN